MPSLSPQINTFSESVSQVNTLPIAKSQTRSKKNKDMHKFSSVYSERGVLLLVLTSGGEWVGVRACKNAARVPPSLCDATQTSDPANPPPCACWARLRDVCRTRPMRTVGPEPLHPKVCDIFWKLDLNPPNICFRLSIWPNGHRESQKFEFAKSLLKAQPAKSGK